MPLSRGVVAGRDALPFAVANSTLAGSSVAPVFVTVKVNAVVPELPSASGDVRRSRAVGAASSFSIVPDALAVGDRRADRGSRG